MPRKGKKGLVLKALGGFYYIQDSDSQKIYVCKLRGKIKQRILCGDRVLFTPLDEENGILEEILPRENELIRPRVANVSLLLIVLSQEEPRPDLTLLDRLLVLGSYHGLKTSIIINKSDLPANDMVKHIVDYYPRIGYPLIYTSTREQVGLDQLRQHIQNEIAVMAGPSGVGKSSLLNELHQSCLAPIGEVSKKLGRGKHTTRHVELYPLEEGGWIVDSPGFSLLGLPAMKSSELRLYFADFYPHEEECLFSDCVHHKERQCGVKAAVERGDILPLRYKHYLSMLEEVQEKERMY